MHLLIPFAGLISDAGRQALAGLELPQLRRLLQLLGQPAPKSEASASDEKQADHWTLTPPHERALAQALGLQGADGALPWAALQAQADGLDPRQLAEGAWGLVTPVHWHVGTDQVSLIDPAQLLLDESSSRTMLATLLPSFEAEGFAVHYGAPQRWYLSHPSLADMPTASLDRVIGRNVDPWLPSSGAAGLIRRLQAEAQMLLYTHPLNDQRLAAGLLPVNSFWLSGCGRLQTPTPAHQAAVRQDDRLRAPALAEDLPGWAKAWETLDSGPIANLLVKARAGQPVQLTLCGERRFITLGPARPGLLQRLGAWLAAPPVLPLLESL